MGVDASTSKPGFYCISNDVLQNYGAEMGPFGIAVLNVLVMHANKAGECHPSHETIAQLTGISRRQVMRVIGKLADLGIVKVTARTIKGMKTSNGYIVPRCDSQSHPIGLTVTSDVTHSPPRCDSQSHKQEPIEQEPDEQAREANASPSAPAPVAPTKIPARNGASKQKRIESPHIPRGTHFENGFIPPGAGQNAVQVYYERFDITEDAARLNPIQEDDLIRQCPDLERLREAVTAYSRTSYRKRNIGLILDWYRDGVRNRTPNSINGASNGTHRRNNGFGRDAEVRDPEPEFIPDAEFLAGMERFNAIRAGRAPAGT